MIAKFLINEQRTNKIGRNNNEHGQCYKLWTTRCSVRLLGIFLVLLYDRPNPPPAWNNKISRASCVIINSFNFLESPSRSLLRKEGKSAASFYYKFIRNNSNAYCQISFKNSLWLFLIEMQLNIKLRLCMFSRVNNNKHRLNDWLKSMYNTITYTTHSFKIITITYTSHSFKCYFIIKLSQ